MILLVFTAIFVSFNILSVTANTACVPSYQITRLPSRRYHVSEVPQWDVKTQSLYYVDIDDENSTLNRYDYNENRVYEAKVDGAADLEFIMPIECKKNVFLIGIESKALLAIWDGRSPKAIVTGKLFELNPAPGNIINDVKTDRFGRFYGGTKCVEECNTNAPATGGFYTYRPNIGVHEFFNGVKISNGLTWVQKTNKFYYIDSCTYDAKGFDYDPKTGNIKNGRRVFSLVEYNGGVTPDYILDGMTNDVEGNLYLAANGGSSVIVFNPEKRQVVMIIQMPATEISSMTFGGPNLDELFVTTSNKDGKQPEPSGYFYKITGLCAKGYPSKRLNLAMDGFACSKSSSSSSPKSSPKSSSRSGFKIKIKL